MDDQQYTNPFAAVHAKVKIFKDRVAAANTDDRELRESKVAEESQRLPEFGEK